MVEFCFSKEYELAAAKWFLHMALRLFGHPASIVIDECKNKREVR
jgi:transposase-like protein